MRLKNRDESLQGPGKPKRHHPGIVLYHGRTSIFSDVKGLIEGVEYRY
jgi:hypothetical protein